MFGGLGVEREMTEVRSRLARLELKVDLLLAQAGVEWEAHCARFDDEVRELMQRGKKLEAVKFYRRHTGASLSDAKRHVESLA